MNARLVIVLATMLGSATLATVGVSAQTPGGSATGVVGTLRGEVVVVLASETAGPVDPSLAQLPALRQPPFNTFRSMRVLERPSLTLVGSAASEVSLPNGRRLRLSIVGSTPQGRIRVRVEINRPGQTDYLPSMEVAASPGEPFFVAGQAFQGGTLVIGVRVGERPRAAIGLPPSVGVQAPPPVRVPPR